MQKASAKDIKLVAFLMQRSTTLSYVYILNDLKGLRACSYIT